MQFDKYELLNDRCKSLNNDHTASRTYHLLAESVFRDYGLEGKQVLLRWNDSPCTETWHGVWMPAVCLKEYKKWLLMEIQPHFNTNKNWGKSKPYRIGVGKINLMFGDFSIKEDPREDGKGRKKNGKVS